MIFNLFGNSNKTSVDPNKELEGLLKAKDMLDQRFQQKLMSNETYLQKAEELRRKIEKCRKKIGE